MTQFGGLKGKMDMQCSTITLSANCATVCTAQPGTTTSGTPPVLSEPPCGADSPPQSLFPALSAGMPQDSNSGFAKSLLSLFHNLPHPPPG